MGLRGPKPGFLRGETSPNRGKARQMKRDGLTYAQIGQSLGVSRQRAQALVAPTPVALKLMALRANGHCERCGKPTKKLEGHHENYAGGPTNFVCTSCHKKLDAKLGLVRHGLTP